MHCSWQNFVLRRHTCYTCHELAARSAMRRRWRLSGGDETIDWWRLTGLKKYTRWRACHIERGRSHQGWRTASAFGRDAVVQTCRGNMAARDATQGRRKAAGNTLHGASGLHPRVDRGDTWRAYLRNGGKAETRASATAGDAKALGRRFAGYGAGGGHSDAGSAAGGGWPRRGGKRKWRCGPNPVRRVILNNFFVLPGGGGDGWCRRHGSTMVTRHYVLWVQQCPQLCTVVSSTVWMTVRGGGRRCVGFGWAKQQVPSPWGENQFKLKFMQ